MYITLGVNLQPRICCAEHTTRLLLFLFLLLKDTEPSPDRRMINLLTFDNQFPPLTTTFQLKPFVQLPRRVTTGIAFSRQNDAGSRASSQYWENLVLVVVPVLVAEGLCCSKQRQPRKSYPTFSLPTQLCCAMSLRFQNKCQAQGKRRTFHELS